MGCALSQWQAALEHAGVVDELMRAAGGTPALERRLLARLSGLDLPPMPVPDAKPAAAKSKPQPASAPVQVRVYLFTFGNAAHQALILLEW